MPSPAAYTALFTAGKGGEVFLRIRAVPGARRDRVLGLHGEALRVAVRAPPERGKANEALVEVIAGALGLHPRAVSLAGGAGSRDKLLCIVGTTREALAARLHEALAGPTGAEP